MSDGRKQILSPFMGVKNEKLGIRIEKYMPVKRRQNLAVTDRELYYKEERLEEFLDSKGTFYNGNESGNDNESYHFANICCKIVPPMFYFIILFI